MGLLKAAVDRKKMWTSGRKGTLSPAEQSKVWALKWVVDKFGEKHNFKIRQEDICSAVRKIGGGHPSQPSVSDLLAEISSDPSWYPGKSVEEGDKPGPKPKFTPQNQQAVANAAMALKRRGEEPSAKEVVLLCPNAAMNPDTGEPFTDKYIYRVFHTRCFDENGNAPWEQRYPLNKTALSPEMQALRASWARFQKRLDHCPGWWMRHVIFFDPCSTILSNRKRAAFDEQQASYGKGKRWQSPDCARRSRNLRGSPYANKQKQGGDRRVWWFVVMIRGHVHFEVMGHEWTQTGEGIAEFVGRLEGLCERYVEKGDNFPRILFSDRGPGIYQSTTGHIVGEFYEALKEFGFRAYSGTDASKQPADMPDVFPHETAVAWARTNMKKHRIPKGGLDDMEATLRKTLAECAAHIEKNYDSEGLHMAFPERIDKLIKRQGERLTEH